MSLNTAGNGFKPGAIDTGSHRILSGKDLHWFFLDFTYENFKGGQALSLLILSIFSQLNSCVLKPPQISEYMKPILKKSAYKPKLVKLNLSNGIEQFSVILDS